MESRTLFTVLTINGTTGADTIILSTHTTGSGATLQKFVDWSVNGGTKFSVSQTGLTSVVIDGVANTVAASDTVNVVRTPAVPVRVIGHSTGDFIFPNEDVLNIGGVNGLQDILGPINIVRGTEGGAWTVTLDNSGDAAAARTGSINGGLFGIAPANITWTSASVDALTVNMGSFGGSSLSVINPVAASVAVAGYSQGADDTLILGSNHVSDGVGPFAVSIGPAATGLWNVSVDDSGGSVPFPPPGVIVVDGGLTGLTGTHGSMFGGTFSNPLSWGPGSIREITIAPPPLDGVLMSALDVPMTVVGNNTQVAVGNTTNGLQSIAAPLTVTGSGILGLNDVNDVTSRSVLMSRVGTAVAIDGLAPATISYDLPGSISGFANVEMDLWSNFDGGVVTVLAAGQTGGLTKIVANRPVAFNVGNVTTAPDIQGTLALYCAAANLKNTLHVNDSIDTTPRSLSVLATKDSANVPMGVIRGLPGGGDVDYAHAQTAGPIAIDGGSGGNTFLVNATDAATGGVATSVALTLNLGSGNDTATVKTNAVTVNGQGGNDSVTVDYSTVTLPNNGGTYSPGDVTFDGGANADTLSIIGKLATQPFTVVATALTQGAQTTSFSNIESLALSTGAFAIANDLNGLNLKLSGSGSTASFATTQHLGTLTVDSSALATLASSATNGGKTLFCPGITLTNSGVLNTTNNTVLLNYTADPVATIRGYLAAGYNNGLWTGTSTNGAIRSSSAAATPLVNSIGYADSADTANPAGLPANTIEFRYTAIGDTNLDGTVGLQDLAALLKSFNTGTQWDQGQLSYGTTVGLTDLAALLKHFGQTASPAPVPSSPAAAPDSVPVMTPIVVAPALVTSPSQNGIDPGNPATPASQTSPKKTKQKPAARKAHNHGH